MIGILPVICNPASLLIAHPALNINMENIHNRGLPYEKLF